MIRKKFIALFVATFVAIFSSIPMNIAFAQPQTQQKSSTKSELKHILKKFAISMSLVGGSGIILYYALRTYKRFKEQEEINEPCPIDVDKSLTTPETVEDATKLFIEKF